MGIEITRGGWAYRAIDAVFGNPTELAHIKVVAPEIAVEVAATPVVQAPPRAFEPVEIVGPVEVVGPMRFPPMAVNPLMLIVGFGLMELARSERSRPPRATNDESYFSRKAELKLPTVPRLPSKDIDFETIKKLAQKRVEETDTPVSDYDPEPVRSRIGKLLEDLERIEKVPFSDRGLKHDIIQIVMEHIKRDLDDELEVLRKIRDRVDE